MLAWARYAAPDEDPAPAYLRTFHKLGEIEREALGPALFEPGDPPLEDDLRWRMRVLRLGPATRDRLDGAVDGLRQVDLDERVVQFVVVGIQDVDRQPAPPIRALVRWR